MSNSNTETTQGEAKVEYIVDSDRAWGLGDYETEALQNLAANWHGDYPEEVVLYVYRLKGFKGFNYGNVEADEVLSEEKIVVDGDALRKLNDIVSRAEIAAEDVFETAEE